MESQTSSDGAATQPVATETSDGESFEEIMHTAKKQNKRLKEASRSMERYSKRNTSFKRRNGGPQRGSSNPSSKRGIHVTVPFLGIGYYIIIINFSKDGFHKRQKCLSYMSQ